MQKDIKKQEKNRYNDFNGSIYEKEFAMKRGKRPVWLLGLLLLFIAGVDVSTDADDDDQ